MIRIAGPRHFAMMPESLPAQCQAPGALAASAVGDPLRLPGILAANLDFIWRLVRRLGVPEADCDDAVQQCFVILSRRLDEVAPGDERSFLFATALRIASEWRRRYAARAEVSEENIEEEPVDAMPLPDEQLDSKRARNLLDQIMAGLPVELGAALALYEFERLTAKEISVLMGIPAGTVASRVRRARELFDAEVRRVKARGRRKGLER